MDEKGAAALLDRLIVEADIPSKIPGATATAGAVDGEAFMWLRVVIDGAPYSSRACWTLAQFDDEAFIMTTVRHFLTNWPQLVEKEKDNVGI